MNIINKNFLLVVFLLMKMFLLSSCKSLWPSSCKNSYNSNYNGTVKVGDPYTIKSKTYEPKIDHTYEEIGLASWYGDDFHCGKTANGELFNKNQMSAAHKTLPLPSVVKVTNQSNGKSVELIVNDRGPFVKNRIIDVSEKAATELGMKSKGVATVKVKLLPKETNDLMKKIAANKKIYYKSTTKHRISPHIEIFVRDTRDQKNALKAMHSVAKLGKVHLVVGANHRYRVVLEAKSKDSAKVLLKKVINMGYKNAKIRTT